MNETRVPFTDYLYVNEDSANQLHNICMNVLECANDLVERSRSILNKTSIAEPVLQREVDAISVIANFAKSGCLEVIDRTSLKEETETNA
mgnify:CR=1 FL=1|tara:strand:- start:7301 stop:7570 length:270 start_codon:yes stop_codon:yes gene_type:complete